MGGKCRSGQVRWVPGRGWEREDGDLLGDRVLQMCMLEERKRWPEGRVSLRSGSDIKSHSGIWVSDRRAHSLTPEQGVQRPPGNTLAPVGASPPPLSSRKEALWLSSHVHSLMGPSSSKGVPFYRWAAEKQRA